MAKQYGITCDRCKAAISHPSWHYKLMMKCNLNNLEREDLDLCKSCYDEIRKVVKIQVNKE
jgi:hypothetical protein